MLYTVTFTTELYWDDICNPILPELTLIFDSLLYPLLPPCKKIPVGLSVTVRLSIELLSPVLYKTPFEVIDFTIIFLKILFEALIIEKPDCDAPLNVAFIIVLFSGTFPGSAAYAFAAMASPLYPPVVLTFAKVLLYEEESITSIVEVIELFPALILLK